MNSLIERVRFVAQPTARTCGQACVAMLTGQSVEDVCHGIGNYGSTRWFEICLALRAAGIEAHVENFRSIDSVTGLVSLAIVSIRSEDERRGHFAVWLGDAYLCPTAGRLEPAFAWELWSAHGFIPRDILPIEVKSCS